MCIRDSTCANPWGVPRSAASWCRRRWCVHRVEQGCHRSRSLDSWNLLPNHGSDRTDYWSSGEVSNRRGTPRSRKAGHGGCRNRDRWLDHRVLRTRHPGRRTRRCPGRLEKLRLLPHLRGVHRNVRAAITAHTTPQAAITSQFSHGNGALVTVGSKLS